MALQSMTGFARVEGQLTSEEIANPQWVWEVRSVNGKGLDFRLRTPPGFDRLQPLVRKLVANYFSRGNLQINLKLDMPGAQITPTINQPVLDAVLDAISQIRAKADCAPPAAENILAIKGVLESKEAGENQQQQEALDKALMVDFEKLMEELQKARVSEGKAVAEFLLAQVSTIETLTAAIVADPSRSLEQVKARLHNQVASLYDNTSGLDLDRVHQEAAILAAKADLQEELDRLTAHIDAARKLLNGKGPLGRKLEFLCQEFNRECNTICSKSNASAVTASGLDMKVVIDQFREQILNLE